MAKKPANLIYGVDENPGLIPLILLGLQHILLLSISFIIPVIIIDEIGAPREEAAILISMAMLATGISTMIQGLKNRWIGSGYLAPLVNGPAFMSVTILAGKLGGLPLIFGMTLLGGIFETLFSRIVVKMRAIFPPEVTGTVVLMVGIEIVPFFIPKFFGVDKLNPNPNLTATIIAISLFLIMAGLSVWGKGKLRLYSALLGMIIGYIISIAAGIIPNENVQKFKETPYFHIPQICKYGLAFNFGLLVPFFVSILSSALKTMGDITTCQKINDDEWKRADMKSIGNGVFACGIGNIISGLLGALGQSISSSNVGLSMATGATCRIISFSTGIILIIMAFIPKLYMLFVIMPAPIMGATLAFAVCFMILAGISIISSRMIDTRKIFVIGASIIFGLSVNFCPDLFHHFPPSVKPIFNSSLATATICAVLLNLLFRIGISKKLHISMEPGKDTSDKLIMSLETQAGAWGARKDVIRKVISAAVEFYETAGNLRLTKAPIEYEFTFDEFNLEVNIHYEGELIKFSKEKPTEEEMFKDENGLAKLSSVIIRSIADKIKTSKTGNKCSVYFHFEH